MAGLNGPIYNKRTRDWNVYLDGKVWKDDDQNPRHFLTAELASEATEAAGLDASWRVR